ncbi:hypothetical protein [Micromonospora sagamiensis]|uniref:Uncharacterized protein n=1 Tax=Micromonospora sagamiensis TaxID=47875 RepID=A0A562WJF4_9ACTN|nr:hypothetical protein [Micromonospora sagamiensis]TWJ30430.1 hypothetical protein JD81_03969 [Micromonospora sagamiensis]BCL16540.1 hypothetical protein GCM10017556_42790 [Micromonospora sagamiensis]
MITRPTARWIAKVREQRDSIAAGTLAEEDAYAVHHWPEAFTAAADTAFDRYEAEVAALRDPSDEEVLATVERVVTALNDIDETHGVIETGEREELCEHVDRVLTSAGVDVGALMARQGRDRSELTDRWRDW